MLGWPRKPGPAGLAFLLPEARALPEIGVLVRNGKVNDGAIAEQKPDVIVDYGPLAPDYVAAERVQAETGISYLLFDGALERSPGLLCQLGAALGVAPRRARRRSGAHSYAGARAATIARQPRHDSILLFAQRGWAQHRHHGRPSTDVPRLFDVFENIADGNPDPLPRLTREQVMAAKPEMVFAPDAEAVKAFAASEWADLPAVQRHQVYAAPRPPFGWIDEPPSVNRLLGLLWIGHRLFADAFPGDMRQQAKDFYGRFYQVEPSDEQIDRLLRRP